MFHPTKSQLATADRPDAQTYLVGTEVVTSSLINISGFTQILSGFTQIRLLQLVMPTHQPISRLRGGLRLLRSTTR
jgi:hypothetical protein